MKLSAKKILVDYGAAVLLSVFMFASNFLNTKLFQFGEHNFSVWFILSILSFSCGWFINRNIGWHRGGKIIFAAVITVTIISILMITFFNEYFSVSELLTENLVLYSLRNITLGSMGFFGMAIQEVIGSERESVLLKEKIKVYEQTMIDSKKEAQITLKEAQVNALKIINDAEAKAKNIILKKERIERELKEFIQIEKELIKKYEEL